MAKKKRSGHRSKKIPVFATAGVAAYGLQAYKGYKAGGLTEAAAWLIGTDASGKFHPDWLIRDVSPVLVGAVGSAAASKLGLNRYVKVPIFKL